MFDQAEARYALRAVIVAAGACAASLAAGADWKQALLSFFVALGGYLGLGAAVPAVEPHIGKKMTLKA